MVLWGIMWCESDDIFHVACMDGWLITLDASIRVVLACVWFDDDLRDVVIAGELRLVSRFRSAEILFVDARGAIVRRTRPPTAVRTRARPLDPPTLLEPRVAWRMIAVPEGALLVHQRQATDEIDLGDDSLVDAPPAYGASAGTDGTCSDLLEAAISAIPLEGEIAEARPIAGTVVVDAAVSPRIASGTPGYAAIVVASAAAPSASSEVRSRVTTTTRAALVSGLGCNDGASWGAVRDPAVAVAFANADTAYALLREPAALVRDDGRRIDLAPRVADAGHTLFHTPMRVHLACASCHPEGADDGHVWAFSEIGLRRTQSLAGGAIGTAPFHWDGAFPDLEALMHEVFVRRMGASEIPYGGVSAVEAWLGSIEAAPRPRDDEPAIARGRSLFESAELACTSCHAGATLGGQTFADVRGIGTMLQVLLLIGVAYCALLMYDGCVVDLCVCFVDFVCGGGDAYGCISYFGVFEFDDLIVYLCLF